MSFFDFYVLWLLLRLIESGSWLFFLFWEDLEKDLKSERPDDYLKQNINLNDTNTWLILQIIYKSKN